MTTRGFTLLVLAVLLAPGLPRAATLRPFGTLAGPTVSLSDLWDDAGAVAATVLGPGPAPGERIIVEAPQLTAIARQFGVDWHAESAAARSILERPGMLLPQAEVEAALRDWLATAGAVIGPVRGGAAQMSGTIELTGFVAPLVAQDAAAEVTVEQCAWEPQTGHFTAALAVTGHAMAPVRLHVAGRIVDMADTLVATHRLSAGIILVAADLIPGRIARERLRGVAAIAHTQSDGKLLRRAVAQGEPVMLAELEPPPVVAKGSRVAITIESEGVSLSATGDALQAGALGEAIMVRNPGSRAILRARISGPGAVRVEPGSLPLPASAADAAGSP